MAPHRYSEGLARRVERILAEDFGMESVFVGHDEFVDPKGHATMARFVDNEAQLELYLDHKELFRGRPTYIIHNTRVYDPDDPVESGPDYLQRQLFNLIEKARDGRASRVAWVCPKSSYEWSHQHLKGLVKKHRHEANALKMDILHLAVSCLDSYILLHPHAPREISTYARRFGLGTYIEVNPMTLDRVNGMTIDTRGMLMQSPGFRADSAAFLKYSKPFSYYLSVMRGDIIDPDFPIVNGNHLPDRTFFVAPDIGAIPFTQDFAGEHGYRYCLSLQFREKEGVKTDVLFNDAAAALKGIANVDSSIYMSDNELRSQLAQIAEKDRYATIRFIILDDKMNTGGTADQEGSKRIGLVQQFMDEYNAIHAESPVSFKVEVELWCTHLRNARLSELKHASLSNIVVLDSVAYMPSLESQLRQYGLQDKFSIIPATAYQLAIGIAIDHSIYTGQLRVREPVMDTLRKSLLRRMYDWINPPNFSAPYVEPAL